MSVIDRRPDRAEVTALPELSAFRLRPSPRVIAVAAGYGFLLWAIAIVLFSPNGWLPVALAAASTALLSFDRKLGPIPAALFVMLALPVGRGSEVGLPRILGDIPVRAHDVVPLVALALAGPAAVRRLTRPRSLPWSSLVPLLAFAAVGAAALVVGLLGGQAVRDIVRDSRWWAFYGIGILALVAGARRAAILRALIWGLTIYAMILIIGLLMPMFNGGLKYGAYAYDPRLRLHYGQAVFLLVGVAAVTDRLVRRPSFQLGSLLVLLSAAIALTLTRTLLVGVLGVGIATAIWAALEMRRRTGRGRFQDLALKTLPAIVLIGAGIGLGFTVYQFGTTIWTPEWAYAASDGGSGISGSPSDNRPVRPSLGRVFDDTENSGFGAQAGGRVTSYALAVTDIAGSPLIGRGLGQQARIPWAWGGFRARAEGAQPGVDNAALTVGLKAGAIGIAVFAAMMLWPLRQMLAGRMRRVRSWYIPAWVALLGLMLIQSYAVSGYAPFALVLLLILPGTEWSGARRSSPSD
ncbi:MAG: hypothetical protein ACR2K4_10760 [Candidatus Limnocylindria bacterium]